MTNGEGWQAMGGRPDPTKEELAMLCEWAREGKLRALKGYLSAGRSYPRNWDGMDGERVLNFCGRLVYVAEHPKAAKIRGVAR